MTTDEKLICVPVTTATMAEAVQLLNAAPATGADLVEIRLDFFTEPFDLKALRNASPLPVLFTYRAVREGGRCGIEEGKRLAVLQQAIDIGTPFVDVEADAIHKIRKHGPTRIIASFHNFTETPADLKQRVLDAQNSNGDIVKFATMANRLTDNLAVFDAIRSCTKPVIGMAMGELGEPSRILSLAYGSILTFGSLETGRESAPGQIPARLLKDLYRVKQITASTRRFAVIGDPIAHSMSPQLHNTAYQALGIDAVYLKFRVADLAAFVSDIAEPLGIEGISVTIPHKHNALAFAAEADELARKIGAANTLTRKAPGIWHAANTDSRAAVNAIAGACRRANKALAGSSALLLGAGGTAKALGVGLSSAGAKVTLANRTREKAEELARQIGAAVVDLEKAHEGRYDVVVNTTSVGMHPQEDAIPVAPEVFRKGMVAFDAVYNPLETRLLKAARDAGAEVADGLEMLVGQAAEQFRIWLGVQPPQAEMREAALRFLR